MSESKRSTVQRLVLDGSIALAWCYLDERPAYAIEVLDSLEDAHAIVPSIWAAEVGNALVVGERRKRSTEADTLRWLAFLRALPITMDDATFDQCWSDALPLARTHNLSLYDSTYLELAIRLKLPLATLDDKLLAAAGAVGVSSYDP
jgi:predicted nucleic acid-binding protein